MKNHGRRHQKKSQTQFGNKSVSASKDEKSKDEYLAIWILRSLGWSSRRIARPTPGIGKRAEIFNTEHFEHLDAQYNQNPCGGGRRVMPHHYGSDYDD